MKSHSLYKHKPTGKIHQLLETYHEEGENKAVTVQVGYANPLTPTESWLGPMVEFQKEFEAVK